MATISIQSMQDLGYQYSGHIDGEAVFVAYLTDHVPDLNDIPASVVDAFKAGSILRYAESHPAKHYMKDGDNYIECDAEDLKDEGIEGFECSVGYCVSLSRHEFGELTGPKKTLVKEVRDGAKMYADVRYSRLLKSAKGTSEAGKARAANKQFMEWLNGVLGDAVKKTKIAIKNGDPTAIDPAKLQVKIEQFRNSLVA